MLKLVVVDLVAIATHIFWTLSHSSAKLVVVDLVVDPVLLVPRPPLNGAASSAGAVSSNADGHSFFS